jgi:thioredoxin-like negative regulator of GroEL
MRLRILQRLSFCVLLCCGCLATSAQGIDFRPQYLHTVLENARAEGKAAIFVDVFTTWCKPCHYMDDSVFTDAAAGTYYNKYFASVQLDAEAGEGVAFAAQHGIKAFPTLLILDLEGKAIGRHVGVLEPQALVIWGGAVLGSQNPQAKGHSKKKITRKGASRKATAR